MRSNRRQNTPAHRPHLLIAAIAGILPLAACTYQVDTTIDLPDANPGDGICEIAPGLSERAARTEPGGKSAQAPKQATGDLATRSPSGDSPPAPDRPGDVKNPTPYGCSLRAAIEEANASIGIQTVLVPDGLYELDLPFAAGGGPLVVTESVRIQGSGMHTTVVDALSSHRVIAIEGGAVRMRHMTLQGGAESVGGAMFVTNDADADLGDMMIRDSEGHVVGGGVVIDANASATIVRSEIRDNASAFGGGLTNYGEVTIRQSTIADNLGNRVGGLLNDENGQMRLYDVTVSGNEAKPTSSGATGGIRTHGFAVLNNTTVVENIGTAGKAGGLHIIAGAPVVVRNSILALNFDDASPSDCLGDLASDSRHNLLGNSAGCNIAGGGPSWIKDVAPEIGPLQDNGGPTRTHALLAGSPARGNGYDFPPPAVYACELFDQRGVPRPQMGDGCDMGAVEYTAAGGEILGFVLVDADADVDLQPLRDGDTIVTADLPPNLSIRAMTSGFVESVVFSLDGVAAVQTEENAPWAAASDAGGDYFALPLAPGVHVIGAVPHLGAGGTGHAGIGMGIAFEVR